MGDSWRFDPNKDYLNDYDDNNGRGFKKFKHKKNRNNQQYDYDDYDKKPRHGKYRPNKNWR